MTGVQTCALPIYNVISRLELYYERDGLMEIYSEGEGMGTEGRYPLIIEGFMLFQLTKNVIFSAAKKMACCMYREKTNFLFTMNQNRKSGTLSPMPFHSPGMLLMQPEFPAADKAVTRKGRHYGREGIKTLGAVCNPKAGYRALRQL